MILQQERRNASKDDRKLLETFFPAGSDGRNRQLEYLLDPVRARYGFQDCNGHEPRLEVSIFRS